MYIYIYIIIRDVNAQLNAHDKFFKKINGNKYLQNIQRRSIAKKIKNAEKRK